MLGLGKNVDVSTQLFRERPMELTWHSANSC